MNTDQGFESEKIATMPKELVCNNGKHPQMKWDEKAEELRMAARSGDVHDVKSIVQQVKVYAGQLSKLLSATDDISGNTPLHFCSANGHVDIVLFLISQGSPTNAINKSGSAPLHYAALTGQIDVVRILLENGASPVVENSFSCTAMDEALTGRHSDVVKYLRKFVEEHSSANPDLEI